MVYFKHCCLLQANSSPPWINWPLFHRRHFQMHFQKWKCWISIQILMKSGPIDHKSTLARVMAWRLAISWTYADPVHWYIYAVPGEDWVLSTSANALWHVRHFVLLLCIWSDMCTSFGAHKPCWVFRSFCYTNQCFYCECYFNLYWSVNYHCMWQMRIVICMAINLIWLDLTWLEFHPTLYSGSRLGI